MPVAPLQPAALQEVARQGGEKWTVARQDHQIPGPSLEGRTERFGGQRRHVLFPERGDRQDLRRREPMLPESLIQDFVPLRPGGQHQLGCFRLPHAAEEFVGNPLDAVRVVDHDDARRVLVPQGKSQVAGRVRIQKQDFGRTDLSTDGFREFPEVADEGVQLRHLAAAADQRVIVVERMARPLDRGEIILRRHQCVGGVGGKPLQFLRCEKIKRRRLFVRRYAQPELLADAVQVPEGPLGVLVHFILHVLVRVAGNQEKVVVGGIGRIRNRLLRLGDRPRLVSLALEYPGFAALHLRDQVDAFLPPPRPGGIRVGLDDAPFDRLAVTHDRQRNAGIQEMQEEALEIAITQRLQPEPEVLIESGG